MLGELTATSPPPDGKTVPAKLLLCSAYATDLLCGTCFVPPRSGPFHVSLPILALSGWPAPSLSQRDICGEDNCPAFTPKILTLRFPSHYLLIEDLQSNSMLVIIFMKLNLYGRGAGGRAALYLSWPYYRALMCFFPIKYMLNPSSTTLCSPAAPLIRHFSFPFASPVSNLMI
jgi:hypothetical protein